MRGLLADANVRGYVDYLVGRMRTPIWMEFWDALGLALFSFDDLGLSPAASDADIWQACQDHQLILITDNRNLDSLDSLESVIRRSNSPECLPVFTIADITRLRRSQAYADELVERIYDFVMRIDELRGTGRLYLP